MTITSFLAYAAALAIAAIIPGPGVAAIVSRALGTGFTRTMPMLFGLILGDIIFLGLAVGGLAILAKTFSGIFMAIKVFGACYLLYLAITFWFNGIEISEVKKSKGRRDGITTFFAGLAVTLANPKTIVFYMALVPNVIELNSVDLHGFIVLTIVTAIILLVTLTPYILLAARARNTLKNEDSLKILSKFAAGALTGTAGWILLR